MKKLVLGSAILAVLGMTSSAMAANSGTVNFTGAVSKATCNLSVQNTAGANIANVDLGVLSSTSTTGDGTAVNFKLVPQEPTCLTEKTATMVWTSPTLIATGLGNAATNGTNATMALTATSAGGNDKAIKEGNTSFDYTSTAGIKSFDFTAQLKRPAAGTTLTPGAFSANASYVVAYK